MNTDTTEIQKKIPIRGLDQVKLFGSNDKNLRQIERNFRANIVARRGEIILIGESAEVHLLEKLFSELIAILEKNDAISENDIATALEVLKSNKNVAAPPQDSSSIIIYTKEGFI
ncbi:MAG TPA: hypothetical protein VGD14_26345, partial [bacterium]